MLVVNGRPSGVQLPASVELTVSETEPGVKGDTVSNVTKPATLETGAVVQVPLFVNPGTGSRSIPGEALHLARLAQRTRQRSRTVFEHRVAVRHEHQLNGQRPESPQQVGLELLPAHSRSSFGNQSTGNSMPLRPCRSTGRPQ